ncbi:MAG: dephospho-CoA kinase [Elusimicrobiota bacterium]
MKARRSLSVGLTGGIAAGKSAALSAFACRGAWTLSLDALAHELSRKGGPLHRSILRAFGRGVLAGDGTLDRALLARRVFADRRLLARLERSTHPLLLAEMRRRLARCRAEVAVVDVPLLFEKGLGKDFDLTVLVAAPERVRLARAVGRGMTRADALRRLRSQWPQARREKLSDVVLENAGSLTSLRSAVAECHEAFRLMARSR